MAEQIKLRAVVDLDEGRRQDSEVDDCLFLLRTSGPYPSSDQRVWGIAAVDLTTATLRDPLFFAAYVGGLSEHGDHEKVFREGSNVIHLSQAADPPEQFEIAASADHPTQREEWLGRPRPQSFRDEGGTTPSPRDGGASYMFRTSDKLAITNLFAGGAAQLRRL